MHKGKLDGANISILLHMHSMWGKLLELRISCLKQRSPRNADALSLFKAQSKATCSSFQSLEWTHCVKYSKLSLWLSPLEGERVSSGIAAGFEFFFYCFIYILSKIFGGAQGVLSLATRGYSAAKAVNILSNSPPFFSFFLRPPYLIRLIFSAEENPVFIRGSTLY